MRRFALTFALLAFIQTVGAQTFPVKIKIEDGSGAVLKGELVIVQDLNHRENEVLRALSDQDGRVPVLQLQTGLYRVIATNPYGPWKTSVREFLMGQHSSEITVTVDPKPTQGDGDVITVGTRRTQISVIGAGGQPAIGASVLVRDREDTLYLERWYKVDGNGRATIELVGEPTVVVVLYSDTLHTTELSQDASNPVIRLSAKSR